MAMNKENRQLCSYNMKWSGPQVVGHQDFEKTTTRLKESEYNFKQ